LERETRGVRLGVRPGEIGLGTGQLELALGDVTFRDIAALPPHGIGREQAAEDVAPLERDGAQRIRQQHVKK